MSVDTFIPEVWSSRLLNALERAHVFAQGNVANRDYEGDIANAGDTVRIQSIGEITISSYTKNTNISAPEALTDAEATLVIDQAKYFNFQVDDVDRRQTQVGLMDAAMRRAGYRLRDTADTLIAGFYASAGSALASSASPKTDLATAGKAYEHLVDLAVLLDENDVPAEDRWVAVPPWYQGALLKDDRFVKSGTPGGEQRLLNGQIGEAAGFAVLKSNNVSNDATTWRIMAGNPMAISFAEQIDRLEAYRPELRFADAIKGLHLYGAKVIRPEALAVLYANKP
jgi:N4-gp56 family major capsid protein